MDSDKPGFGVAGGIVFVMGKSADNCLEVVHYSSKYGRSLTKA
jgi:hypothetical protein